jgi:hypothetical protein
VSLDYLPWYPVLSSSFEVSDPNFSNKTFSHEDFGIDNKWVLSSLRLRLGLYRTNFITLTKYGFDYKGETELKEDVRYNEHTFSKGDKIESQFSLSLTQVDYAYYPVIVKGVRLGFGLSIIFYNFEASIRDLSFNEERTFDKSKILPIGYIHLGYEYKNFDSELLLGSFFNIKDWGTMNNHVEVQALYSPFKYGSVGIGYRSMKMSWDFGENGGYGEYTGVNPYNMSEDSKGGTKGSVSFNGLYMLVRLKFGL